MHKTNAISTTMAMIKLVSSRQANLALVLALSCLLNENFAFQPVRRPSRLVRTRRHDVEKTQEFAWTTTDAVRISKDREAAHKASEATTSTMTSIYITTNVGEKPSFSKTADGKGALQALVPFGGSATSVKNPDKHILGGKGLGLQEMSSIGIDVPPGFTLTTPVCQIYQQTDDLPAEMWDEVKVAIERIEKDMGRKFGDASYPLLFSCRSGAAISMPGMMDTVLNVVSML